MKQLGNLAMVCAQRPDVLMQLHNGEVLLPWQKAGKIRVTEETSHKGRIMLKFSHKIMGKFRLSL